MAVKILIRRRVVKNKETQLVPLLIELRAKATTQPGFISGETLRNVENAEECLMISTWKSADAWNAWKVSRERAEIHEKMKPLMEEEEEFGAYFYG